MPGQQTSNVPASENFAANAGSPPRQRAAQNAGSPGRRSGGQNAGSPRRGRGGQQATAVQGDFPERVITALATLPDEARGPSTTLVFPAAMKLVEKLRQGNCTDRVFRTELAQAIGFARLRDCAKVTEKDITYTGSALDVVYRLDGSDDLPPRDLVAEQAEIDALTDRIDEVKNALNREGIDAQKQATKEQVEIARIAARRAQHPEEDYVDGQRQEIDEVPTTEPDMAKAHVALVRDGIAGHTDANVFVLLTLAHQLMLFVMKRSDAAKDVKERRAVALLTEAMKNKGIVKMGAFRASQATTTKEKKSCLAMKGVPDAEQFPLVSSEMYTHPIYTELARLGEEVANGVKDYYDTNVEGGGQVAFQGTSTVQPAVRRILSNSTTPPAFIAKPFHEQLKKVIQQVATDPAGGGDFSKINVPQQPEQTLWYVGLTDANGVQQLQIDLGPLAHAIINIMDKTDRIPAITREVNSIRRQLQAFAQTKAHQVRGRGDAADTEIAQLKNKLQKARTWAGNAAKTLEKNNLPLPPGKMDF